ncbi:phosphotransferase [Streptomyces sp. FXJ1.4098]|nr:phosphotransferase [Streptomyces sp. FXJ1.4098]
MARALRRLGLPPLVPDGLVSHPGRNDNWAGRTEDGQQVFVKRLDRRAPDATARFDRAYAFQVVRAAAGPFSWSAPVFLGGDREALVMVYALLEGAVSGAALAEEGRFDAELARRAGRAVGELHGFHPAGVPAAAAHHGRGLAPGCPLRPWRSTPAAARPSSPSGRCCSTTTTSRPRCECSVSARAPPSRHRPTAT